MNIGALTVTIGADTKGLTAALNQSKAALASFENRIQSTSQSLRSFGWLATTVLTAPILGVGKAAIKMGMDFEFALSKIEGLVGIAKDQTKAWGEELLKMGAQTSRGPQELADALYYVSSAGFKTEEALRIVEMAGKAAATGMGNTTEIANVLTSSMNAYRASGLTAAKTMDIFTAAVREGKLEPAEFARVIGQVIPIAAEARVSIDQVAGAMAAMSLGGASAANAGTWLRNVLVKILNPSKEAEDALMAMGTSSGALQRMLGEQGLMPTLLKIRELTNKYGRSITDIFPEIRALLGALSLTGENLKYNQQVMDAVTNSSGSFNKAFQVASETMQFKWNKALAEGKAAMVDLGKSVASAVLPILENLIQKLKNLIEWFNNLSEEQKQSTLKWIAFAAAIGPLSLIISTVGLAINTLIKTLTSLGTALRVVKLALLTNPWTALATVVAGIVGYFIHLRNKAEDAAKANNKLADSLVVVEGAMKSLKDLGSPDYSRMSLNELTAANLAAYNSAKAAEAEFNRLEGLRKQFPGHNRAYDILEDPVVIQWENSKRVYQETNKAIDEFSKRQPQVKSIVNDATNGIVSGLENAKSKLDKFFEDYIGKLEELNRKTSIKNYKPEAGFYEKFFMRTTSFANRKDVDIMNELANDINFVTEKEKALGQVLGTNRDLYNQTTGNISAYSKALENLLDIPVSAWDKQWYENLKKVTGELKNVQKEFDALEDKRAIIEEMTSGLTNAFMALFNETENRMKAFLNSILQSLQRLMAELLAKKIVGFLINLFTMLSTAGVARKAGQVAAGFIGMSGFAKGGIVPGGYPNDTYPALLSSGETVLPKALTQSLSRSPMLEGEVVFEIAGDKLVGILKKQSNRNSLY